MSLLNPAQQPKIPERFKSDIEAVNYFEQLQRILLQIIERIDDMSTRYDDAVLEPVPDTSTLVYTCPVSSTAGQVVFANATNTTGTAATISINIVQYQGTAGATNRYVDSLSVAAGGSEPLTNIINAVLRPGDTIYATAGTASAINLKIGMKEMY